MKQHLNIYFILISILIQQFVLSAQQTQVVFKSKSFEFNDVKDWSTTPAIFQFTNNSKNKITLLKTTKQNISVILPDAFIMPQESAEVKIYYKPLKSGPFIEKVKLYSSDSDQPLELTIRGNVATALDCPTFDQQPIPETTKREVLIINHQTGDPIPNASISFTPYLQGHKYEGKTNSTGVLAKNITMGTYNLFIQAKNFKPLQTGMRITRSSDNFIYELEPLPETKANVYSEDSTKSSPNYIIANTNKSIPKPSDSLIESSSKDNTSTNPKSSDNPNLIPISAKEKSDSNSFKNTSELSVNKYSSNNLVFLIDVSTSMKNKNKMPLLKISMKSLINVLREIDIVSLITYASHPKIKIECIRGNFKDSLNSVVDSLIGYGSTRGLIGLKKAYEIVDRNYVKDGNNQVILATDGELKGPEFNEMELMLLVETYAKKGIIVSVIAFGKDEEGIALMQKIALAGKGSFIHILPDQPVNELLIQEIKLHSAKKD